MNVIAAAFENENYNRNTAKRKTVRWLKEKATCLTLTEENTNYIFAPKLDATALARDTSLMSFCTRSRKQFVEKASKPVKFDHNSR